MANENEAHQFATFFVDGLFFGIGVLNVQEVLRRQEMTRVPLAPPVVEGLINLRGQIVTALDMRRRLRLRPRGTDQPPMNVVVRSEDGAVSLLVDEIGDVVHVTPDQWEPAPRNLAPEMKALISGVYKLSGRLLLVLNTDRVLEVQGARE